jgi:hypothetical protein
MRAHGNVRPCWWRHQSLAPGCPWTLSSLSSSSSVCCLLCWRSTLALWWCAARPSSRSQCPSKKQRACRQACPRHLTRRSRRCCRRLADRNVTGASLPNAHRHTDLRQHGAILLVGVVAALASGSGRVSHLRVWLRARYANCHRTFNSTNNCSNSAACTRARTSHTPSQHAIIPWRRVRARPRHARQAVPLPVQHSRPMWVLMSSSSSSSSLLHST